MAAGIAIAAFVFFVIGQPIVGLLLALLAIVLMLRENGEGDDE